jgi:hypothetical protein
MDANREKFGWNLYIASVRAVAFGLSQGALDGR